MKHKAVLSKREVTATLQLDNDDEVKGSTDLGVYDDRINTYGSPLFIGGLPQNIAQTTNNKFTSGFSGCLQEVSIYNYGKYNFGDILDFTNDHYVDESRKVTCSKTDTCSNSDGSSFWK